MRGAEKKQKELYKGEGVGGKGEEARVCLGAAERRTRKSDHHPHQSLMLLCLLCRDFVKTDLVPFAKRNPQVKIETASTRGVPTVQAEYCT